MNNNNDNRTERNAKPWYKVWWIWVIIVIAFIILLMFISGNNDTSDSTNDHKATQQTTKQNNGKHNTSSIPQDNDSNSDSSNDNSDDIKASGNTLDYNGYQTKINKVTYWGGDSEFDTPDKGKQFVIVNVTITNNQGSKIDYNPYDYQLSDNGNETDFDATITNDKYNGTDLNDGSLQSGASVSGNLMGEAEPGHKLQLVYTPNTFEDKSANLNLN